jgi:hypothetical protein
MFSIPKILNSYIYKCEKNNKFQPHFNKKPAQEWAGRVDVLLNMSSTLIL